MRKIVALTQYAKQAKKLLTSDERLAMEASIAENPTLHPIISGTGGCRKARWGRGASGKSGGVRAIFYFFVKGDTVFFLLLYAKNEMENLTDAEQKELKALAKSIEAGGRQ